MAIRFWIELSVGIITLIAILIFGKAGTPVFALLALSPIIYRLKKSKQMKEKHSYSLKEPNILSI